MFYKNLHVFQRLQLRGLRKKPRKPRATTRPGTHPPGRVADSAIIPISLSEREIH